MIKILQNWIEIGEATNFLNKKCVPRHSTTEKNWDLCLLYRLTEPMSREKRTIDLGCGNLDSLKLLYAMGFKNLIGIDLSISLKQRLSQFIRMYRDHTLIPPFRLSCMDLTKTNFEKDTFDLAICVSVLEHGISLEEFIRESFRILKKGGVLFITVDYWYDRITVGRNYKPYNLSWEIFSRKKIEYLIDIAQKLGFVLYENSTIPHCSDKCIVWNGSEYTFLCIIFKK